MDEARTAIERAVRADPGLNLEGLALLVAAHPERERAQKHVALLREYWPDE
jgi:hypothetical protein